MSRKISHDVKPCRQPVFAVRARIAADVYDCLYDAFESFETMGMYVAYLTGGILSGKGMELYAPLDENEEQFDSVMRTVFHKEHTVWQFYGVNSEET